MSEKDSQFESQPRQPLYAHPEVTAAAETDQILRNRLQTVYSLDARIRATEEAGMQDEYTVNLRDTMAGMLEEYLTQRFPYLVSSPPEQ